MTYPFVFANESGNQPASQLDTMFNIAGQQGNIPCTATGTNAITLTPDTNYYVPAAYTKGQIVSFKPAATTSGAVTAQLGGLAFIKVFMPSGIQANTGDLVNTQNYMAQYFLSLDGGNGGFQITNGTTATAVSSPLAASFKNLKIVVASDTTLTPTADEIIVENASGGTVRLTSVAPAVTATSSVGTANGIVSAVAANTWYSFWFIYNPNAALSATNPGGWLDTNATTPTPPAGYTYWARYGWVLTDASSHLNKTLQLGAIVQYIVQGTGATTPILPLLVNAAGTGTYSTTAPTWAAFTVQNSGAAPYVNANAGNNRQFVPPTAGTIRLVGVSGSYKGGSGTGGIQVAPNATYKGPQDVSGNAPPYDNQASAVANLRFDMMLEAVTVQAATSTAGQALLCFGWIDNI